MAMFTLPISEGFFFDLNLIYFWPENLLKLPISEGKNANFGGSITLEKRQFLKYLKTTKL